MKRGGRLPPNEPRDPSTGLPGEGEPVYLAVGKLRRPHGVQGDLIMDLLTDFPERLRPGKKLYVGEAHEPLEITSIRGYDRGVIIRFAGFHSPEEAGRLRNAVAYVRASEMPPLPEGTYYHHELIGLRVEDTEGQALGELVQILVTGANDVYVVRTPEGNELLLPAVDEVILEVDLPQKRMRIQPQNW